MVRPVKRTDEWAHVYTSIVSIHYTLEENEEEKKKKNPKFDSPFFEQVDKFFPSFLQFHSLPA